MWKSSVHHPLLPAILMVMSGCAGLASPPVVQSGLQKGEDIIPWNPIHVAGPNAGTNACPVCTYEARPAVVIFTRDGKNAWQLAGRLENLVVEQRPMDLKGFVVVVDSASPEQLKQRAASEHLSHIGICYPDPQTADHDLKEYRINPAALNTVMFYRQYKVAGNWANLDAGDFEQVRSAVVTMK